MVITERPNILWLAIYTSTRRLSLWHSELCNGIPLVCYSERALLAVTLSNDVDEILAHAAFLDYPNIADVDPAEWVDWLNVYFSATGCNALNTVFMHYFVSKKDYADDCASELVCTMFSAVPDVHNCLLAVPAGIEIGLSRFLHLIIQ